MSYTINQILHRVDILDGRILRTQMKLTQSGLADIIDLFESQFLSILLVKPRRDQRSEALQIAIKTITEEGSYIEGIEFILKSYFEARRKFNQFNRILRILRQQRNDVVSAAVFDFGANNVTEIKSISVSKSRNKAQVVFMYNNKSLTRHLQYREDSWWGSSPIATNKLGVFIKYRMPNM